MNQFDFWQLDHDRLAADYCAAIRSQLTSTQLKTVNLRNSAEHDPAIDHVHDFIDNTDAMTAALANQNRALADSADEMNAATQRSKEHNYQLRRVLVACEFSGIVRDAIAGYGHDVISCDTLPTEKPGKHYVGDVREILNDGYSDMISHPPCTYICGSALWRERRDPTRIPKGVDALDFVRDLMAAPVERQMLENPVGRISTAIRKPDQYVQPYDYGHDHSKKTGLWLDGLPALTADPADHVPPHLMTYKGRTVKRWGNQSPCGADSTPPSPERWRIRSRTFAGIAQAIAAQWFNPLTI